VTRSLAAGVVAPPFELESGPKRHVRVGSFRWRAL